MGRYRYPDIHVHTSFSTADSTCPMDRYLQILESGQSPGIGFADHLHANSEHALAQYPPPDQRYRPPFDHHGYSVAVDAARARGLRAYKGIELSYEMDDHDFCMQRVAECDYDYLIGSVHTIGGFWIARDYHNYMQPGYAFDWVVDQYYDAILHSLTLNAFDVIAHIGVYRRFMSKQHRLMIYAADRIAQREEQVAKACAQSAVIIEVNTSGLLSSAGITMPTDDFLRAYRRFGGERLVLASDAHDAANVHQGFDVAADMLRALGFRYLYYPWENSPIAL